MNYMLFYPFEIMRYDKFPAVADYADGEEKEIQIEAKIKTVSLYDKHVFSSRCISA